MELAQLRTSLLKWSTYTRKLFFRKIVSKIDGSDVRNRAHVWYLYELEEGKKWYFLFLVLQEHEKNAFILPTFFKWCEIKGISKRGKNDIQPFQILTWKDIELSPTATIRFSKMYDFTLLINYSWPYAQCENPLCITALEKMFRLWMWNTLYMKLTWFWDTEFQHFEK